jgi:hypothetical protein
MKKIYLRILVILFFLAFGLADAQNIVPLVRYYSNWTGKHFYTTQNDAPAGYYSEGTLCYVSYPNSFGVPLLMQFTF